MLGLGLDQFWRITPQEYLALQREQQHLYDAQSGNPAAGAGVAQRRPAGMLPPDVLREEQDMAAQARAMFWGGDVPCG